MILEQDKLRVRPIEESDVETMVRWLSDPMVLTFYGGKDRPHDEEMVREDYLMREGDPAYRGIVEWEGTPVGFSQHAPWDEGTKRRFGYPPDAAVWEIEQFIGEPAYWNRGIGTVLITSIVQHLFDSEGADLIVAAPLIRNTRAIRCYEKCGFQRVRLLPRHQVFEGTWQNCWLMEARKG